MFTFVLFCVCLSVLKGKQEQSHSIRFIPPLYTILKKALISQYKFTLIRRWHGADD